MNFSTEISPSTQIFLDELHKLFDKFEAKWGLTQQDPARATSRVVSVPTQAVAVDAVVVADNWGGFFNGGVVSCEAHCATPSLTVDNWGGLFEQPAHDPEERDLRLSAIDAFDSDQIHNGNCLISTIEYALLDASEELSLPLPCGSESANLRSELELGLACPEQLPVNAAVTELTSTEPDALLDTGPKLVQCGSVDIECISAAAMAGPDPRATLVGASSVIVARPPRLCVFPVDTEPHGPISNTAAVLNASYGEPVFVGADMQRIHDGFALDNLDLRRCVRLTFRLGSVQCALGATLLHEYDGSLDDDPESGFAHLDGPLDRAVGRIGQTLAAAAALREDAIGAAGGGLLACVVAVGSALTFSEAASNDATALHTTCSMDCTAACHCFLYGTWYNSYCYNLGPAIVIFQGVAEHSQPRYFTANLVHAYSVDGAVVQLCSATNATHVVQRVSGGIVVQNLVQLRQPWPPPMDFVCLGNGVELRLLFGFTQCVMVPKPPWPPDHNVWSPNSKLLVAAVLASWDIQCSMLQLACCEIFQKLSFHFFVHSEESWYPVWLVEYIFQVFCNAAYVQFHHLEVFRCFKRGRPPLAMETQLSLQLCQYGSIVAALLEILRPIHAMPLLAGQHLKCIICGVLAIALLVERSSNYGIPCFLIIDRRTGLQLGVDKQGILVYLLYLITDKCGIGGSKLLLSVEVQRKGGGDCQCFLLEVTISLLDKLLAASHLCNAGLSMNGSNELQPWPTPGQDCNILHGNIVKPFYGLWSIVCVSDTTKAQRNLHMHAPVCLIPAQIIVVPWTFWPWFTRYTSMQLTCPRSLGIWACCSARMIACSVDAQSVTLKLCWELMMLDMGFWTTNKETQYSASGFSLTCSLFLELIAVLISMSAKGNTRASILPFGLDKSRIIWDPGGLIFLHRLGGKPHLKGRGMSGYVHGLMGWPACISQHRPKGHCEALQKQQATRREGGHRIFRTKRNQLLTFCWC